MVDSWELVFSAHMWLSFIRMLLSVHSDDNLNIYDIFVSTFILKYLKMKIWTELS